MEDHLYQGDIHRDENSGYRYEQGIVQQTRYGMVKGFKDSETGTLAWLGIPYAKPPVGPLRWKAPRELSNWQGILDATYYRSKSLQKVGDMIVGSEDCLYLNIWRPDSSQENLPVLVWAHGGGNLVGSGEDFRGDILAAQTQSIIVSLNYRLGIMGWFRYQGLMSGDSLDDSGNYGLLDIFKALAWVRDNIALFGGNPHNITLAGHSAGARNVATALISPQAQGLFQKLLLVSGGRTLAGVQQAEDYASEIVGQLLVQDHVVSDRNEVIQYLAERSTEEIAHYLREKSPEDFIQFYGKVEIRMSDFPHLFKDGQVIPAEGFELIARGEYQQVPIILGSDATEYAIYNMLDDYWQSAVIDLSIRHDPEKLQLYLKALDFGSRLFACLNADSTADFLAAQTKQPPVYVYRLAWGTREGTLKDPLRKIVGASHQVDLDFITGYETYFLNTMYPEMCYTSQNKPGRDALTLLMMSYLGNYLYSGDPNSQGLIEWYPWTAGKGKAKTMVLDANADKANAHMTSEHFNKEEIVKEMHQTLSSEELHILSNILFKGRFFMEY